MANLELNKGVSIPEFEGDLIRCSNCRAIFLYPYNNDYADLMNPMDFRYCPMCGAKMESEDND